MSTPDEYLRKMFGLSDQVVVVLGGTGVLGGALSMGIAQAGAMVVVAGRDHEKGKYRVDKIAEAGGAADYRSVEITSRESLKQLLDATLQAHGRVDGLVNCAGVNAAAAYLDVADEDWDRVIGINLTAAHLACQVFGRHMVRAGKGGSILNVGSVSSDIPLSRVQAYSVSKAGLLSLSRNIAMEFAPYDVRVNVLCPGFFPAEQNRAILDDARVSNIMRHTPMARFGEPQELVGAALLLLSRTAGSFMTGAAVYVDGGFTATTI
jgi:NAD(P)-dependent dehydrogenase (short-subunit alcohol dehydrogenase family)